MSEPTGSSPKVTDGAVSSGLVVLKVVGSNVLPAAAMLCGTFRTLRKPGRFGEPNFCNARVRLYIYQCSQGEWAIGSRRGASSCRARMVGGFSLLGHQSWKVFDGSNNWEEVQMLCAEGDEEEETVFQMADAVVVSSLHGTWTQANLTAASDVFSITCR